MLLVSPDAVSCLLKVLRFCEVDVGNERLRISVDQRKSGALNVDHDPMSLAKSVQHVQQFQANR